MIDSVICDDAFNLLKRIPDRNIDLVLTDIPYGVVTRDTAGLRNLDKGDADTVTFDISILIEELIRVCTGSIYVFCATEQVSELRAGFISGGLTTRLCIWEKTNPSPVNGEHLWLSSIETCVFARKPNAVFNEYCKSTVWRYATEHDNDHPTIKPLKLFDYLVRVSSDSGQIVLDPFVGSGTTAVAAKRNGRHYIAGDINPDYVILANNRLETTCSQTNLIQFPTKTDLKHLNPSKQR